MNVLTVYEDIKKAVADARDSGQPTFIEAKTYRYKGHSMSDPAKYRTRDEVDEYKKQDPILILKAELEEAKLLTAKEYDAYDAEIKVIVDESVEFAEKSEEPALHTLYEDVLAE
jgi:pyruvate dehydrogenase E1 component alpha subunit